MMTVNSRFAAILFAVLMIAVPSLSLGSPPPIQGLLERDFVSPPDSAKPRVWWHWLNGNVTTTGIALDLQWMHRIGIGGVQKFDVFIPTPDVIPNPAGYMTPDWDEALRYAVKQAQQLGLEFAVATGPGWSTSGAPWVDPRDGMKKIVWSETTLAGSVRFKDKLPLPPAVPGPFQNVPWTHPVYDYPSPKTTIPDLYKDIAVIGYRLPLTERSMAELNPVVHSSDGAIDQTALWDGDFATAVELKFGADGGPAWIMLDFGRPVTMQSMSIALQELSAFVPNHVSAILESAADGIRFHTVTAVKSDGTPEQTIAFEPTSARYYRLLLPTPPQRNPPSLLTRFLPPPQTSIRISEFKLYTTPRVDHFERKAGFAVNPSTGIHTPSSPANGNQDVLLPDAILDLTSHLAADGSFEWTPPAGRWEVLRIGYSLLGTINHPAAADSVGLEVDKLDRQAVRLYIDNYLDRYASIVGKDSLGAQGITALVSDSWEAGSQNWTEGLPEEFSRRRGYQLRHWLPALTGRIIISTEATDRFLWDFRRTLAELVTENYYGQFANALHQRHMIYYSESHETGRAFIGDGMDAKSATDVPMGAMWSTEEAVSRQQSDADLRESASVAHLYGQSVVAAESLTAIGMPGEAFAFAPEHFKDTLDREFADGVNRIVIHTSTHQPLSSGSPGVTLGPFGVWFTRKETWADMAGPWIQYLSRSSYLLQQGQYVADIAYYYGQDSNITALFQDHLPPIPEGYSYDFINSRALTLLSVKNNALVTATGMRYRLLVLDPSARYMSLDALRQMERLARAGAIVVGDKPQHSPSLADSENEFRQIVDAMWGSVPAIRREYGRGAVLLTLADALAEIKLVPDCRYSKPEPDTKLRFLHRQTGEADLYFLSNALNRTEHIQAQFRITGKLPELWHADTGRVEKSSYRQSDDQTTIALTLNPYESVFVVFRQPSQRNALELPSPLERPLSTLNGPWKVRFRSGDGSSVVAWFPGLQSWSASADPAIKYFSGVAEYAHLLRVPHAWLVRGHHIRLDLGNVENLAEVIINGHSAGVAWKPPFQLDITGLLRAGSNTITVRVANLWVNRLIGDKQPNARPMAVTTFNPYGPDSPLLDSGLLGPVTVTDIAPGTQQSAREHRDALFMAGAQNR